MRRAALVLSGLLALALVAPAAAHHELEIEQAQMLQGAAAPVAPLSAGPDERTANMSLVRNWDASGTYRQGSDLAFWKNLAVLGSYDNPGGFRLVNVKKPSRPRLVGQLDCPGPQNDVSIWKKLVFLSVDSPRAASNCGAGSASHPQIQTGTAWEGVRVVSIANRRRPRQVAAVFTDCGSHTHTLVPDTRYRHPVTGKRWPRVLIYSLSYPLNPQSPGCNPASHRQISVVEVPLRKPSAARVVSTPDVSPAVGCHDVTVFLARRLAGAACISESQMWDISDPANPRVISHITNPQANIHHSTTFSWDGRTMVLGDELGGALATPGCMTGGHAPLGALWFYDVTHPSQPRLAGSFVIPQDEISFFCTAHNFNTIPMRNGRDVLVTAWYNGGTAVIDYTNPAAPRQVGYYLPKTGKIAATWSSYWYNGRIFANNFDEDVNSLTARSRGLDVFRLRDPATKGSLRLIRLNPQTQEPLSKVRWRRR